MLFNFRFLSAAATLASIALAGTHFLQATRSAAQSAKPSKPSAPAQQPAPPQRPSSAELNARADALIQNQHRDDEALEFYERVEREIVKSGGPNPRVLSDKTFRVVPTGTGTFRILVKNGDSPVDPQEYHRQLLAWRDVLELALNPDDPRTRTADQKFQKKRHDRADLVDAARKAFAPSWGGQENMNGHLCDVYELAPSPDFHPRSMFQEALVRVTAKAWVDHQTNQLVRGEAHITRDISFGGGILGKLYRGGVFWLEQSEVSPGIWLPSRYQYDFTGRKFLFVFEEHQYIEMSHYRRIGPPKDALQVVQAELASGKTFSADP
jgi:hypothetical protein